MASLAIKKAKAAPQPPVLHGEAFLKGSAEKKSKRPRAKKQTAPNL
jgi:hypothetical protein